MNKALIQSKSAYGATPVQIQEALSAQDVQNKIGIRTYGMSATIPELRERLQKILEYEVLTD